MSAGKAEWVIYYWLGRQSSTDEIGTAALNLFFFAIVCPRTMCPHTAICVLILLYMCPHTAIYVSSYCYICVLILLYVSSYCYMCPHTIYTLSSRDQIGTAALTCFFLLSLLSMCPRTMCPHAAIYVSSYSLYS